MLPLRAYCGCSCPAAPHPLGGKEAAGVQGVYHKESAILFLLAILTLVLVCARAELPSRLHVSERDGKSLSKAERATRDMIELEKAVP